jgi:hypothetical protein
VGGGYSERTARDEWAPGEHGEERAVSGRTGEGQGNRRERRGLWENERDEGTPREQNEGVKAFGER